MPEDSKGNAIEAPAAKLYVLARPAHHDTAAMLDIMHQKHSNFECDPKDCCCLDIAIHTGKQLGLPVRELLLLCCSFARSAWSWTTLLS